MLPMSFSGSSGVSGSDTVALRGGEQSSKGAIKNASTIFNITAGRANKPDISNPTDQSAGDSKPFDFTPVIWIAGIVVAGLLLKGLLK